MSMQTTDAFLADMGEIGQRWCKRASKEIALKRADILLWMGQEEYEKIAAFVLSAATTGHGD